MEHLLLQGAILGTANIIMNTADTVPVLTSLQSCTHFWSLVFGSWLKDAKLICLIELDRSGGFTFPFPPALFSLLVAATITAAAAVLRTLGI